MVDVAAPLVRTGRIAAPYRSRQVVIAQAPMRRRGHHAVHGFRRQRAQDIATIAGDDSNGHVRRRVNSRMAPRPNADSDRFSVIANALNRSYSWGARMMQR